MKTIIRGRDSGKAQELLQFAREENAMIITQNKRAFKVKAAALGFNDIKIVDYEDLANENFAIENSRVIIHNADAWMEELFFNTYGFDVIGFSATEEQTMEKYDYEKILYKDIKQYIEDEKINFKEYTKEDLYEKLSDELWDVDKITGNGPFGYASEEQCAKYVGDNLKLAFEALREFETRLKDVPDDFPAKYMDATVRCYLFHTVLGQVLDDLYEKSK